MTPINIGVTAHAPHNEDNKRDRGSPVARQEIPPRPLLHTYAYMAAEYLYLRIRGWPLLLSEFPQTRENPT